MSDDLGMAESAQNLLNRIDQARDAAEHLSALVEMAQQLKAAQPGRVDYAWDDEHGHSHDLTSWIEDKKGRFKELLLEEITRQIAEEYDRIKNLGFN